MRSILRDHPASLLAVLLVALALRIVICFFGDLSQLTSDSLVYMQMAYDIVDGTPSSFFPNGFPLLIAGMASVLDDDSVVPALLAMNAVLSAGVVVLVYLIARPMLEYRYALLATALVALWPNQLHSVRQVMSEVPSAFFLTAGICLLLNRRPLSAGVLLFIAGTLRTTLAPVSIVVAAVCLAAPDRRKDAALLIAAFACGLAAEYALQATGIVRGSSNIGHNLLLAISGVKGLEVELAPPGFAAPRLLDSLSIYLRVAIDHPADFLAQRVFALYDLWGPWPGPGDVNAPRSLLTRLVIGFRFPLLLLALVGLWNRRTIVESWIIAAPVLVVTAIHTAFFSGQPRYTCPVEPLVMILASAGVAALVSRRTRIRVAA
jgi:hypothetical protein